MVTTLAKHSFISHDVDRSGSTSPFGKFFESLEEGVVTRVLRRAVCDMDNLRVLDVACGSGRLTRVLADEGLEVVAGDASDGMLRTARAKLERYGDEVTFRRLDMQALDLPDRSFELVSCLRLDPHAEQQPHALLRELARVSSRFVLLKSTCSSPCDCLRRTARRAFGQSSRTSATPQAIQAQAEQAGLRVRSIHAVLPGLSDQVVILLEKI